MSSGDSSELCRRQPLPPQEAPRSLCDAIPVSGMSIMGGSLGWHRAGTQTWHFILTWTVSSELAASVLGPRPAAARTTAKPNAADTGCCSSPAVRCNPKALWEQRQAPRLRLPLHSGLLSVSLCAALFTTDPGLSSKLPHGSCGRASRHPGKNPQSQSVL